MKKFKWSKRQMTALRRSIVKKWIPIVEGTGYDDGAKNCPCCAAYNRGEFICGECPIAVYTRQQECHGTPYFETEAFRYRENGPLRKNKKMLAFLKKVYVAGGGKLKDLK